MCLCEHGYSYTLLPPPGKRANNEKFTKSSFPVTWEVTRCCESVALWERVDVMEKSASCQTGCKRFGVQIPAESNK